jgi:hypothetical protein
MATLRVTPAFTALPNRDQVQSGTIPVQPAREQLRVRIALPESAWSQRQTA